MVQASFVCDFFSFSLRFWGTCQKKRNSCSRRIDKARKTTWKSYKRFLHCKSNWSVDITRSHLRIQTEMTRGSNLEKQSFTANLNSEELQSKYKAIKEFHNFPLKHDKIGLIMIISSAANQGNPLLQFSRLFTATVLDFFQLRRRLQLKAAFCLTRDRKLQ